MTSLHTKTHVETHMDNNMLNPSPPHILPPHILIVDDDAQIRQLLQKFLERHDWLVSVAEDTATAQKILQTINPDLIILDIMMPNETGIEFLQKYRQNHNTAVLMLTAKTNLDDKINGLLAGADDYLTKPFEPNELSARIKAILRCVRNDQDGQNVIMIGATRYDCERGILYRNDIVEKLTDMETRILNILCAKPRHIFSRQDISEHAQIYGDERAVDVQITHLRKKLETDSENPEFLQTVRDIGYTLYI